MSDETAHSIDEEVRAIVNRNYARAREILIDNMDILHAMKDALVKYETIEEEQIKQLMNREPVTPPSGWGEPKTQQAAYANSTTNDTKPESAVENTAVSGQVRVNFFQDRLEIQQARTKFSPWYARVIGLSKE